MACHIGQELKKKWKQGEIETELATLLDDLEHGIFVDVLWCENSDYLFRKGYMLMSHEDTENQFLESTLGAKLRLIDEAGSFCLQPAV